MLTNSLIVNNVPSLGTLNFTVKNFENVRGTAQNDSITGDNANNILSGGGGNDVFGGSQGNDIINGDAGTDTANYSALGQTIVLGTTGTVTKAGGFGTDQLNKIETITASTLLGDTINASAATGSTSITANLAINSLIVNSVPSLGTLNFTVNNFENVTGTAQSDIITGNTASNILSGGAGNDFLAGDAGNDTLIGGNGTDVLAGGAGNDRFTLLNPAGGVDIITDFASVSDKIAVSASGFGAGLTLGTLSSLKFIVGASATTAAHRFIYNNAGGLFFDVDGNGGAAQQQIASLTLAPTLTSSNILVIA
ncbi:calcium-binding protein [aff. Roholtiella sp. LEGE 12411]|uniref:calcium-binding protein n=1 Tax=aff. Roholtiella sp. LEGE 12411 TaxID=1828822 RepID=UPI001880B1CF|nr:calcium-binding protein [aff. Roholtiella sp. LEGE 12411]